MIDKFYQELRERALVKFTQTGSKEDEAKIGAFQISDTIRQIEEIFSKIDNCLKLSWDDYYKLAVDYYNEHEPKGEFVLILEGRSREEIEEEKKDEWNRKDINEHMAIYEAQGYDRKEAMKKVAADRGVSKREIYKELI